MSLSAALPGLKQRPVQIADDVKSALRAAVRTGNMERLSDLISNQPRMLAGYVTQKLTLLEYIISRDAHDAFDVIRDTAAGIDPDLFRRLLGDVTGDVVLLAAKSGHRVLEQLHSIGLVRPRLDSRCSPLHEAALAGDDEAIRLLMDWGFNPDQRAADEFRNVCEPGATPLHLAILMGHIEAAKVLLESGARPDVPMMDGTSPLLLAIYCDNRELAALLWNGSDGRSVLASVNMYGAKATLDRIAEMTDEKWSVAREPVTDQIALLRALSVEDIDRLAGISPVSPVALAGVLALRFAGKPDICNKLLDTFGFENHEFDGDAAALLYSIPALHDRLLQDGVSFLSSAERVLVRKDEGELFGDPPLRRLMGNFFELVSLGPDWQGVRDRSKAVADQLLQVLAAKPEYRVGKDRDIFNALLLPNNAEAIRWAIETLDLTGFDPYDSVAARLHGAAATTVFSMLAHGGCRAATGPHWPASGLAGWLSGICDADEVKAFTGWFKANRSAYSDDQIVESLRESLNNLCHSGRRFPELVFPGLASVAAAAGPEGCEIAACTVPETISAFVDHLDVNKTFSPRVSFQYLSLRGRLVEARGRTPLTHLLRTHQFDDGTINIEPSALALIRAGADLLAADSHGDIPLKMIITDEGVSLAVLTAACDACGGFDGKHSGGRKWIDLLRENRSNAAQRFVATYTGKAAVASRPRRARQML